ncbi:putative membrane protein [Synechococcus sp. JA-3-3Ab]|nr:MULTISPECIES: AI-2E family transporter [unclassified Synechococcus]ABC99437.1 putative membrane protein [Synechococcus sp. JA-3-3Ab]
MSRRQLTLSVSSIALVVATGMLLLLLWQLRNLVVTVMIAVVVAAALAPLVDLAERMRIPRWLGVVVYLSFIAGIAGLALLMGPTVVTQTQRLLARLPSYLERLQLLADTWIADLAGVDPAALDYLNQLLDPQSLMNWAVRSGQQLLVQSFDFTRGLLGGLLTVVLTLFISGYMLVSGSDLVQGLVELFPYPWNERLAQQVQPMAQRMGGYIQGRVLVSAILGVMIAVSLRFLGLSEFALALGVIAGFTNLIPFIGPVLGSLPALVVAIVQGGWTFLWVLILYVAVQNLETYVLDPLLVGSSVRVKPLYQLLAVLGGTQLLGIVGAVIAPPWVAGMAVLLENLYLKPKQEAELRAKLCAQAAEASGSLAWRGIGSNLEGSLPSPATGEADSLTRPGGSEELPRVEDRVAGRSP